MSKLLLLLIMTLFPQTQDVPKSAKNDPNGIWQMESGTKFEIKQKDDALSVRFVEGSNPVYVKYEVSLKNAGETNTYQGAGYFIAKVQGKECRFDTSWSIVVVQPDTIAGYTSRIVPEPGSCEVKERQEQFTQLKKVQ